MLQGTVEACHLVPFVPPHEVDGFVAGDCIEPGPKSFSGLELFDPQVNAEEGSLKDIFGMLGVA
jgi:hypothetical protein